MLTREQALAIYQAGPETVVRVLLEMDARIRALEERVKALEDQLAKNSRNSSQPPSTDGYKKPAPKNQRPPSERSNGGQPGHEGQTLKQVARPDHIVRHCVNKCRCCGRDLSGQKVESVEKRQVFDLPPVAVEVTEHQAETKVCAQCHTVNKAAFPGDVTAPVQYGARLKAVAVYLRNYQLLPSKRTVELFQDLYGWAFSEGTLSRITQSCSGLLRKGVEQIKELVTQSGVVGFDETGCSVKGKLQWLHVASTPQATFYDIHPKRGAKAMDAIGILPRFEGRAIHDFWKPYFTYACTHGLCNAHHLRELTFVHEEDQQAWAKELFDCLVDMKKAVDKARLRRRQLSGGRLRAFEARYQQIIEAGATANPLPGDSGTVRKKRGKRRKSKARNLLERLDAHRQEALAFLHDFRVPFDNNLAERDLRMMKTQQKISGTFRSVEGAKAFCCIRSYISTARKNAVNVIRAIEQAFAGQPFVPVLNSS